MALGTRKYVGTCSVRQMAKPRHHKPYGQLGPFPDQTLPFREILIRARDIYKGRLLVTNAASNYCLTVVVIRERGDDI